MANQFDEYDDEDTMQDDNGPANLRKALKRAEKERKALEAELNQIRAAQREQSIKSMLESEGVNPKIAGFIPKDLSTPEQVKSWLSEYADVFGAKPATQEPEVEDPRAAVQSRMTRAVDSAQSAPSAREDLLKKVQAVTSRAELDELTGNMPARFQRN